MKRSCIIAGGLAACLLNAAPAYAADPPADPLLVEKLKPAIGQRCDRATQRIPARSLAEAIETSEVAPLFYSSAWSEDAPHIIARAAFGDASGPNEASLIRLQRLVQTWVDPDDPIRDHYLSREAGGVSVVYRNGGRVPRREAEAALVAILSGDDSRYAFSCIPPSPDAAGPDTPADTPRERVRIALARTPDDLQADLSDKSFAEFAYVRNEVTNEDSFAIHATLGAIFPRLTGRDRGRSFFWEMRPIALVQYEREGSDTGDEVNNLNFGVQAAGFIQTRGTHTLSHYYTLTARYLTDDRFESSAWSLGATITPEIPLPGNDIAYYLIPNRLRFQWLVTLAADHFSVDDPGRKTALQTANEFTRAGLDLDGELRLLLGGDNALSLHGEYQFREAFGRQTGDAQLLTVRLAFEPAPQVAVGLTYTRGENLDSLEFGEQWKFTFGLRF
jgi:hypothetical protein